MQTSSCAVVPKLDETTLTRIVVARIYGRLSFGEITTLLKLAYRNGTHHEQYFGLEKRQYTTENVTNDYAALLQQHLIDQVRHAYLHSQSLLLQSHLIRELVHIKAGADRVIKPTSEQKLELSWFEYVQSLPEDEVDKAKEWARAKAVQDPKW